MKRRSRSLVLAVCTVVLAALCFSASRVMVFRAIPPAASVPENGAADVTVTVPKAQAPAWIPQQKPAAARLLLVRAGDEAALRSLRTLGCNAVLLDADLRTGSAAELDALRSALQSLQADGMYRTLLLRTDGPVPPGELLADFIRTASFDAVALQGDPAAEHGAAALRSAAGSVTRLLAERSLQVPLLLTAPADLSPEDPYAAALSDLTDGAPGAELLLLMDGQRLQPDAAAWSRIVGDTPKTLLYDLSTCLGTGSLSDVLRFLEAMASAGNAPRAFASPQALPADQTAAGLVRQFLLGDLDPADVTRPLTFRVPAALSGAPKSAQTIETRDPRVVFTGTASPLSPLLCNGKALERTESGDFSVEYTLQPGENIFRFSHENRDVTVRVIYQAQLIKSVSPASSVRAAGRSELTVEVVALRGASVQAELNGAVVRLQPGRSGETEEGLHSEESDFQTYTGVFRLPESRPQERNLGYLHVSTSAQGTSDQRTGGKIYLLPEEALSAPEPSAAANLAQTTGAAKPTVTKSTAKPTTAKSSSGSSSSGADSSAPVLDALSSLIHALPPAPSFVPPSLIFDFSQTSASIAKTESSGTAASSVAKTTASGPTGTSATKAAASSGTGAASTTKASAAGTTAQTTASTTAKSVQTGALLTPYANNGVSGKSKMCEVTTDYATCRPVGNRDFVPQASPLLKGTFDYIDGQSIVGSTTYYHLRGGKQIAADDVKVISSGYNLPLNSLQASGSVKSGALELRFGLSWKVPFNAALLGQSLISSNGYPYGVKSFSATGLEIVFSHTTAYGGKIDTAGSVISAAEWSRDTAAKTVTLRLTFREAGHFYGYQAYYDGNALVIRIKAKPAGQLQGAKIVLDPGHGGTEVGSLLAASHPTLTGEHQLNLLLAKKMKAKLEAKGATVYITRSSDVNTLIVNRVKLTREKNPDVFVSIHCDSFTDPAAMGTSAFYYRPSSYPLASAIHQRLAAAYKEQIYTNLNYTGTAETLRSKVDRGTKYYPFAVTRIEECPSTLVEFGFGSNPTECKVLQADRYQEILAQAAVDGIADYLKAQR
ncbi:MAG: N-acetylmuramoyl-L-alanine amidase [Oscillospiraceae bacterium]|jgi:N-acetylmuramoyl-L-alanine amidase|nr:N-acetylmuramoyl-L-alanine amidase [Oscillospiraceae bacterium]